MYKLQGHQDRSRTSKVRMKLLPLQLPLWTDGCWRCAIILALHCSMPRAPVNLKWRCCASGWTCLATSLEGTLKHSMVLL